jgi:hypothetical protein
MKPEYSQEFWYWFDRVYCQSPTNHQYDDEKMWEAWKAGYKQGRDNAYKRKDIPIEIFTIPKEKHQHTMNKLDESINDNGDLYKDLKDNP